MRTLRVALHALAILLAFAVLTKHARADRGSGRSPDEKDEDVKAASEAFTRGVALSREQKWGEALEAFDLAASKKKHSLTTYNRGVAERALGRFTRARFRFTE